MRLLLVLSSLFLIACAEESREGSCSDYGGTYSMNSDTPILAFTINDSCTLTNHGCSATVQIEQVDGFDKVNLNTLTSSGASGCPSVGTQEGSLGWNGSLLEYKRGNSTLVLTRF